MSTRKQLNTDILLQTLSQSAMTNVLLMSIASKDMSREDRLTIKSVALELSDKTDQLVTRSIVLDKSDEK